MTSYNENDIAPCACTKACPPPNISMAICMPHGIMRDAHYIYIIVCTRDNHFVEVCPRNPKNYNDKSDGMYRNVRNGHLNIVEWLFNLNTNTNAINMSDTNMNNTNARETNRANHQNKITNHERLARQFSCRYQLRKNSNRSSDSRSKSRMLRNVRNSRRTL